LGCLHRLNIHSCSQSSSGGHRHGLTGSSICGIGIGIGSAGGPIRGSRGFRELTHVGAEILPVLRLRAYLAVLGPMIDESDKTKAGFSNAMTGCLVASSLQSG